MSEGNPPEVPPFDSSKHVLIATSTVVVSWPGDRPKNCHGIESSESSANPIVLLPYVFYGEKEAVLEELKKISSDWVDKFLADEQAIPPHVTTAGVGVMNYIGKKGVRADAIHDQFRFAVPDIPTMWFIPPGRTVTAEMRRELIDEHSEKPIDETPKEA